MKRHSVKFYAQATKHKGLLHRHLGVSEERPIPMHKLIAERSRLDKEEARRHKEGKTLPKKDLKLLREVNFAIMAKRAARER